MKFLRRILDNSAKHFEMGGRFEKLHPFYEAADTLFYSPGDLTRHAPHVRDTIDLKRMMGMVVFALMPCVAMALYNTGYQANLAIESMGEGFTPEGWRAAVVQAFGLGFDSTNVLACAVHGGLYFFPVMIVTYVVGGNCEVVFALVRKHEINEGFFVTGLLFPLILPPTIPLWQVAVGITFGVILGKEVFGGTGMNIFNPALISRMFLFFAYPGQISGEKPWVALQGSQLADGGTLAVDGYSGPTALAEAMRAGTEGLAATTWNWWDAFWGFIPGSMGETSAFACLLGAVLLIVTKVGSWRTMLGVLIGSVACGLLFNVFSPTASPWPDVLWGLIPGAVAKALVLAFVLGAAVLTMTGVSSWRKVLGVLIGSVACSLLLNGIPATGAAWPMGWVIGFICVLIVSLRLAFGGTSWRALLCVLIGAVACALAFNGLADKAQVGNPFFDVSFQWHLVLGGWAFGAVFMATDPVSSAYTDKGKLIYGLCIGALAILIRVLNPAYPEGMMLAIILMNVFAPLIDHYVVQANIKRRLARNVEAV